jgi:DNA topoisomerase IB
MSRRSATQQDLSSDMLTETVQQDTHVFSLPTGPAIKTAKSATDTASVIIMPEMSNAVICPDTGKSLKHQELITVLRYKTRWMC